MSDCWKLLRDSGAQIEEYSCASHPSEMQMLVKDGHGLALIREGTTLDEELTTRPIMGVDVSGSSVRRTDYQWRATAARLYSPLGIPSKCTEKSSPCKTLLVTVTL